jgi:hypothetical protein
MANGMAYGRDSVGLAGTFLSPAQGGGFLTKRSRKTDLDGNAPLTAILPLAPDESRPRLFYLRALHHIFWELSIYE